MYLYYAVVYFIACAPVHFHKIFFRFSIRLELVHASCILIWHHWFYELFQLLRDDATCVDLVSTLCNRIYIYTEPTLLAVWKRKILIANLGRRHFTGINLKEIIKCADVGAFSLIDCWSGFAYGIGKKKLKQFESICSSLYRILQIIFDGLWRINVFIISQIIRIQF